MIWGERRGSVVQHQQNTCLHRMVRHTMQSMSASPVRQNERTCLGELNKKLTPAACIATEHFVCITRCTSAQDRKCIANIHRWARQLQKVYWWRIEVSSAKSTHTHTHTYTNKRTHLHTHIHTHAHTHTHTYTHTHTHITHTHTPATYKATELENTS